ncbi:MAG: ester cyclase [Chloroflexi bacterium]|nr:ester cyclase [Chloroflexota bacterium]
MSLEANKAIVRRYQALYNANDLDALGDIVAVDVVSHKTLPGLPPGLEGGKFAHRGTVAAIPDLNYSIEDLIAEGDKVVMRWTMTGTHSAAPFMGLPPTGNSLRVSGISIFRLANGKIVEHWAEPDGVTFMQQLGLMPAPA